VHIPSLSIRDQQIFPEYPVDYILFLFIVVLDGHPLPGFLAEAEHQGVTAIGMARTAFFCPVADGVVDLEFDLDKDDAISFDRPLTRR